MRRVNWLKPWWNLGKAVGRKRLQSLPDMSQPLGRAIGNRLKSLRHWRFYKVKDVGILPTLSANWLQIMLGLANVNKTVEEVHQHLENGKALAKFEEMVQAQGGDLEDLYRPVNVAHGGNPCSGNGCHFSSSSYGIWALCYETGGRPCSQV